MPAQKPRHPRTCEHAVQKVIGILTADGAAEAVGKSRQLVYAWGDGDDDRLPNARQMLALDRACNAAGGGMPIRDFYNGVLDYVPAPPPESVDICLRRLSGAVGRTFDHHEKHMEDGRYDAAERAEAVQDAHDIIDRARAFIDAVEPPSASVEEFPGKRGRT